MKQDNYLAAQNKNLRRRLEEHEVIALISEALNETLALNPILQLIAESARRLIPQAERTVIHLYDEQAQTLQAITVTETGELDFSAGLQMRLGEGIAGRVLANGQLINVEDTHNDQRYISSPGKLAIHRSLLVAPIKNRHGTIGTISVHCRVPYAFANDDERLLALLGSQAALAINNARLFAAEQQARHVAETLSAANQALTQSLNLDDILDTLFQYLAQLISFDSANVMLLDSEAHLIIRAWRGYSNISKKSLQNFVTQAEQHGSLKKLLVQQASQIIPDTTKEKDWWHQVGEKVIGGWMGIPLVAGGKLIGAYSLDKYETNFFNEEHLYLAETFAAQAAVAIQNGLLYEAEREQFGRLQASQVQLIQAEKMGALGRLVASIAHEINNPIQSMQGCVTLIGEELNDKRDQDTIELYLGIVKSELTRIANIVHNMRDFYRLAPEKWKVTDVHVVLDSVLKLTGKQLKQKRIVVQKVCAADLPTIMANSNHLQQVFLNIILNAIDAMPQGGDLYIETMLDKSRPFRSQTSLPAIRIDFRDTGEGIPANILDNLFEPFFTTKEHGSGLGLSISYGIIEAHHGEILVSSEEGAGTTFTILLPIEAL